MVSYNALAAACEQHGSGEMGREVVGLTRVKLAKSKEILAYCSQFGGSPCVFDSEGIAGVLETVSLLGS